MILLAMTGECLQPMAVHSKLLLLPDELLLFMGQLLTFDAGKALRSCNR